MSQVASFARNVVTVVPMLVLPWSVPVWCLSGAWWALTQAKNDDSGYAALLALYAPSLPFVLATSWLLERARLRT